MAVRLITRALAVFFALIILVVSLVETSAIKYAFSAPIESDLRPSPDVVVNYELPEPSTILPNSPVWPALAMRDKILLESLAIGEERATYALTLADNRLSDAQALWEMGEINESLGAFEKAEGYLLQAHENTDAREGVTSEFISRLSRASLKHRQVLEDILAGCAGDARPTVTKMMNTSKMVYEKTSAHLVGLGLEAPENPF